MELKYKNTKIFPSSIFAVTYERRKHRTTEMYISAGPIFVVSQFGTIFVASVVYFNKVSFFFKFSQRNWSIPSHYTWNWPTSFVLLGYIKSYTFTFHVHSTNKRVKLVNHSRREFLFLVRQSSLGTNLQSLLGFSFWPTAYSTTRT